jgi:hypothetical protein
MVSRHRSRVYLTKRESRRVREKMEHTTCSYQRGSPHATDTRARTRPRFPAHRREGALQSYTRTNHEHRIYAILLHMPSSAKDADLAGSACEEEVQASPQEAAGRSFAQASAAVVVIAMNSRVRTRRRDQQTTSEKPCTRLGHLEAGSGQALCGVR